MRNAGNSRMATAAIIVMSSMVLSRLTGFVRETMLSWKVGLSWVQDAYVAAFTVPDLMYMLLVGGTISAALVPFLSGKLDEGREEDGWKAASSFINVVFAGMIVLCAAGVVFAPKIIPLVAPGFSEKSPQTRELSITLARILFPSVSFIMLAGICNGILNSYRKFAVAAYGPSIYNIGCALSIFLFAEKNTQSMIKVAAGVATSAFVYFLIQLVYAVPNMKLYRPILELWDKGFQKLFGQAVPSLLSSSVTQINAIISTAFVSLSAAEGGLSAFRNANTVWQLPYGIFAMGIGTAMLPTLSGKYAIGETESYKNILMRSLKSVLFLSIPSAVAFVVLRVPIIGAIFEWGGRFTDSSVHVVANILVYFTPAMVAQSVVAIVNRAYYARQDTRTPLLIGCGSVLMNLIFGSLFYRYTGLGAAGMALSYSLISAINSVLLLLLLNKKAEGLHMDGFFSYLAKAAISSAAMSVVLALLEFWCPKLDSKPGQLLYLMLEIVAGSIVYFIVMLIVKSQEALYYFKLLKQKLLGTSRLLQN